MNHNVSRVAVSLMLAVSIAGCATVLLSSAPVSKTVTQSSLAFEDIVVAIGRVDGGDDSASLPEGQSLVFIGLDKAYVVKKGAVDLSAIAFGVNGDHVAVNAGGPIKFVINGDKFYGVVRIVYRNHAAEVTDEERRILRSLKFHEERERVGLWTTRAIFWREIYLAGEVYGLGSEFSLPLQNLKRVRQVQFYELGESITVTDSRRVSDKFAALPLAVMFDVVTFPIQTMFLASRLAQE